MMQNRLFDTKNVTAKFDEDKIISKGSNGTLSLVFDRIKRLNKGERHLKITCDNVGRQNKNNATI